MKKILVSILLLAAALSLSAQNTTVSATVVDSDSTAWANGTWTLSLVPGPSQPNPSQYTCAGSPFTTSFSGTMNGSGVLSQAVCSTVNISPIGSLWKLQVCPNASAPCGSIQFTAAGSTQDVSSTLTSQIPAPRFNATSGSYGYADIEATLVVPAGGTYWNVVSGVQRCYNNVTVAWGACSAAGSGGINQLTGDVTAGPGTGSQASHLVATTNGTIVTLTALSLPYSQLTGTPTIPTSSSWPNAGSCTSGQFVNALVNGSSPTCGTPSGTGTVTSGSGYALPIYSLGASTTVGPSNITSDSTGNNLNVPGTLAAGGACPAGTASGNVCALGQVLIPPGHLNISASTYGALGNTQYSATASTTSGLATVNCSGCSFVSGDVGKIVWVMEALGTSEPLSLSQTTISSVNSSTQITAGMTAGVTGSSELIIWGSDDTTALSNAWAAAKTACATVSLNAGLYLVQAAEFNTGNASCGNNGAFYNQPGVSGQGKMATFLVPTPNFSFTNCASGDSSTCFLGADLSIYSNFSIWGTGNNPSGGASKNLAGNYGGFLQGVDLSSWCQTCSGSVGVKITGAGSGLYWGGSESFGATTIYDAATNAQLYNFVGFGSNIGLEVHDTNLITTGDFFKGSSGYGVIVDSGYVWNSYSDTMWVSTFNVNGVANVYSLGYDGTPSLPVLIGSGGILRPQNSTFPFTQAGNAFAAVGYQGQILDATQSNTYSGGAVPPQAVTNGNATGVTSLATTIAATATGSLLVVAIEWLDNASQTVTGCSDGTNTYTQQGSTLVTPSVYGGARGWALFYSNGNLTSGNLTITCSFSASTTYGLVAASEFLGQFSNGTQSTSPFEGVYTNTGSGTSISAGATTTTTNPQDIVGLFLTFNGTPTYSNTGLTQTVINNGTNYFVLSDSTVGSPATYTLTGTLSANSDWAGYWFKIITVPNAPTPILSNPNSVTASAPYICVGSTCYDNQHYAVTKPPRSPAWINSVAPTVTPGINGNLTLSSSSATDYWMEEAGSASSECDFGPVLLVLGQGTVGCYVWDSTNNTIWDLQFVYPTSSGVEFCVYDYSYNGTGNPSYVSGSSACYLTTPYGYGQNLHVKLSKSGTTLSFYYTEDGGGTYLPVTNTSGTAITETVGTISDGGVHVYPGSGHPLAVSILSVNVQ